MVNHPFFSIAIPTYNRASKLKFTLFNLLKQNYRNFEIVVSDNDSTDNTEEIVKSFHSDRIRYFKNKTNLGGIPNLGKAIEHARGKYIFLHGDDDMIISLNALSEIHKLIIKNHPGFIRANYLCKTDDNKSLFRYPYFRRFQNDQYLRPQRDISQIRSFIFDSEPYFITGIIFRNKLPRTIGVINSELCYWIEIIIYLTQRYGAFFIKTEYVIASWSKRVNTKAPHVLYALVNGKLASENFLRIFKKYLPDDQYKSFLYKNLKDIYVDMFPAIKFSTSNQNLLQLSNRIRELCPDIAKTWHFKFRLFVGLLLPKLILGVLKEYYFYKFSQNSEFSEIKNKRKILKYITGIENEYLYSMKLT